MPSSTSNTPLIVEGDVYTDNGSRPSSPSSNFSRSVSSESGEDEEVELENSPRKIPMFHSNQRSRRKRKGLIASRRARRGNDPFDYEQKYPEDEEFKEMGPAARVWKVFLDEFAKFDTDRVEDWRDSLDVLLVFAGLFSAVVTTFVVQTCQSLEVDKIEIGVSLLYEIAGLACVIAEGGDAKDVPLSVLTPSSPARPSFTDTWVNALWFTSLALSLTTALLAVLTKQWIHQYMILPSGTPLDRSRIRQFRYDNLETWRVGVIVGLLPVLMHVSLGVFFAGLVLYLYKLSVPISEVVGLIAALTFVVYFGTTFLPIYKPTCPYKTPLTSYSYSISYYLYRSITYPCRWICGTKGSNVVDSQRPTLSFPKLFEAPVPKQTGPASLKAVEKKLVRADAERLDARALSWLYKISLNSSVQRIVMQALANIPLPRLALP